MTPSDSKSTAKSAQKSDSELALRAGALSGYASLFSKLFERHAISVGINELRDASRQADYARERAAEEDFDKAREQLEQAGENIYKALNSAGVHINREIDDYEKSLKYVNLNDRFDNYQALSGVFARIKRQIEKARESRDQRDEVYRYIAEGADFTDLLNYFDELRGSICAIRDSITKEKRRYRKSIVLAVSLAVLNPALNQTVVGILTRLDLLPA